MITTCGVILIKQFDTGPHILLCKVTNSNFFSIPKGVKEHNETDIQAAYRELYEETNILLLSPSRNIKECDIEENDKQFIPSWVVDIGIFNYKKNHKQLHAFVILLNKNFIFNNIKCNTTYKDKKGKEYPEVCGYEWVNINTVLNYPIHDTQKQAIQTFLNLEKNA
jgi:8-oxo-dGTP pyrophosphatase MutT (NUDIX family)